MKIHKLTLTAVILTGIITITVILAFRQQAQIKAQANNDVPVLDYEAEIQKTANRESTEKSKYFDSRGTGETGKQIAELPSGVEPLPVISHWWLGLSALPFAQADVVLLGEVADASAHLSNNKTGIYSEFSVQVKEVFKGEGNAVNLDGALSVNRTGGGVRFASGRVNIYRIYRQGMPQKGVRYVLFLNKIPKSVDYLILTGYKLSNGKVTPLDGEDDKDPRSDLPFAKYREADESRFLEDLRNALQPNPVKGDSN